MDLGDRIKALRERMEWTQTLLAKKIGISKSVMSRIEAGTRPLEDSLLVKLVEIFDVSADYIIGTEQKKPNIPMLDLSDDNILLKVDVIVDGKSVDEKAFKEAVQYLRVKNTQK